MDQKKQGQQSEGFKDQQQPQHQQGQQKWQEPQPRNPNTDPTEGRRDMPGHEKGGDLEKDSDLDRDTDTQDEQPERGRLDESER